MEPLALYIHWPFCLAKCPYCDFNSHVRERIPQARFARGAAARSWRGRRRGSGGGRWLHLLRRRHAEPDGRRRPSPR